MASGAGDEGRQASLSWLFGYDKLRRNSGPEGNPACPLNSCYIRIRCRAAASCAGCWRRSGQPYRDRDRSTYGPAMKGPDYLAVNPMGKVPAIKHGDDVVTEGAAICAYLADAFPEAGLAPPPGDAARDYYRWLFFGAGPVEAATTNKAWAVEPPEGKTMMVGYGRLSDVLDALEFAVSQGEYIAGRPVHRGRRLSRLADRLRHDVRRHRKAPRLRKLLRADQPAARRLEGARDRRRAGRGTEEGLRRTHRGCARAEVTRVIFSQAERGSCMRTV